MIKAIELKGNINEPQPLIVFCDFSGMTSEEIASLKD
jgi:hypothetical protein